jgi:hypothetical protein
LNLTCLEASNEFFAIFSSIPLSSAESISSSSFYSTGISYVSYNFSSSITSSFTSSVTSSLSSSFSTISSISSVSSNCSYSSVYSFSSVKKSSSGNLVSSN